MQNTFLGRSVPEERAHYTVVDAQEKVSLTL